MTPSWTYTEAFVKKMYVTNDIFRPEHLDFQTIAYCLRINLFYWHKPSQALFFKDKGYIMLCERLSTQQQWQDFCHELAHVLLHTGNQGRMSPLFREYQENKANHFMYHACVPSFMLDEIEPYNLTVEYVQKQFNVEYDFALKRLEQYLSKWHLF